MNHLTQQPARTAFSAERRRALLDEYFATKQSLRELRELADRATGLEAARLSQHQRLYVQQLMRLREEYTDGVPVLPLSRCPFTGQVAQHSIDHFGLDGLWWDYEAAVRPEEQLPPTFFALAGALHLTGGVPWFPFLCKPGPEVPYVVPRMLQHSAVMAVLSTVAVGGHQGYAITYFANPVPHDIPRVNTWGTNEYLFLNETGEPSWDTQPENPSELDFELEPWISAGRLTWIAPGDQTLTLRDTAPGCPYLGLPGRQTITRVQEGEVWWG